jgi:hypothetical protein
LGSRISARAARFQPGKHFVNAIERPFFRRSEACKDEIFFNVEAAENAPLLMDQLHTGLRDDVTFLAGQLDAIKFHRACARRDHAHQGFQRGAFACAVAAEQSDDLVALDVQ